MGQAPGSRPHRGQGPLPSTPQRGPGVPTQRGRCGGGLCPQSWHPASDQMRPPGFLASSSLKPGDRGTPPPAPRALPVGTWGCCRGRRPRDAAAPPYRGSGTPRQSSVAAAPPRPGGTAPAWKREGPPSSPGDGEGAGLAGGPEAGQRRLGAEPSQEGRGRGGAGRGGTWGPGREGQGGRPLTCAWTTAPSGCSRG